MSLVREKVSRFLFFLVLCGRHRPSQTQDAAVRFKQLPAFYGLYQVLAQLPDFRRCMEDGSGGLRLGCRSLDLLFPVIWIRGRKRGSNEQATGWITVTHGIPPRKPITEGVRRRCHGDHATKTIYARSPSTTTTATTINNPCSNFENS